jgi:hypothetical protein
MRLVLVGHTHWDREWYEPFPVFQDRLLELLDGLLELMGSEPRFRHFHLVGMGPLEAGALGGQAIQVRGAHVGVSGARQRHAHVLVGQDLDDVRPGRLEGGPPRRRHTSARRHLTLPEASPLTM